MKQPAQLLLPFKESAPAMLRTLNRMSSANGAACHKSSFSAVRSFLRLVKKNPGRSKPYRLFKKPEDALLYHKLHPAWAGLSNTEIRCQLPDGGEAMRFYFLADKLSRTYPNESKRREFMGKMFRLSNHNWADCGSVDGWKAALNAVPLLKFMTITELTEDKEHGGHAFYRAVHRWAAKTTPCKKEARNLVRDVFSGLPKAEPKTVRLAAGEQPI